MSVTESSAWRWWPGMQLLCDVDGVACIYVLDGQVTNGVPRLYKESDILANEGRLYDSESKVENIRPGLECPSTQGAIIFGIFEPLGYYMSSSGFGVHRVWYWSHPRTGRHGKASGSRADLIRAVFAARDSEADHG